MSKGDNQIWKSVRVLLVIIVVALLFIVGFEIGKSYEVLEGLSVIANLTMAGVAVWAAWSWKEQIRYSKLAEIMPNLSELEHLIDLLSVCLNDVQYRVEEMYSCSELGGDIENKLYELAVSNYGYLADHSKELYSKTYELASYRHLFPKEYSVIHRRVFYVFSQVHLLRYAQSEFEKKDPDNESLRRHLLCVSIKNVFSTPDADQPNELMESIRAVKLEIDKILK